MNATITNYQSSQVVTDYLKSIEGHTHSHQAAQKFFTWLDGIITEKSLGEDKKEEVYTAGTNYLQAIFQAKYAGRTEVTKEVTSKAKDLSGLLPQESGTEMIKQGELFAAAVDTDKLEFLGKQGPLIAACLASTENIKLMRLIVDSINPELFTGNGVELNEDSLKKLTSEIQNLYKVSSEIGANTKAAIQEKLTKLGLSQDQASKLKEFLQAVIKKHENGAATDPANAWIQGLTKNLANEKGIMAIGTVVFMFGGLLTNIPFIGPMIAPLVEASKSLLGAMQGLVPIMLMARSNTTAQPIQEPKEPSSARQAAINAQTS